MNNWQDQLEKMALGMSKLYRDYLFLLDSQALTEMDRAGFLTIWKLQASPSQLMSALANLCYLLKLHFGKEPILLLDDVLSELDSSRQRFLIESMRNIQVFITATEIDPDSEEYVRYIQNLELATLPEPKGTAVQRIREANVTVVPNGKQTYWTTTDSAWKTKVTADTAFTVDFSTKIKTCDLPDVDRTLLVWCASPRATGVIMIGRQSVYWQVTSSMGDNILLDSSNNIDGQHVFRITYDGATRHGFTVWRDGVKIGENLVDCTAYNGESWSFVRFGIPGKNNAGAFDIDYIRWDTTGAYDWKDPRKGLQIKIR